MEIEYKDTKKVHFKELKIFETFVDNTAYHHDVCFKINNNRVNGAVVNSIKISDSYNNNKIEYGYLLDDDIVQRVKVKMIVET